MVSGAEACVVVSACSVYEAAELYDGELLRLPPKANISTVAIIKSKTKPPIIIPTIRSMPGKLNLIHIMMKTKLSAP